MYSAHLWNNPPKIFITKSKENSTAVNNSKSTVNNSTASTRSKRKSLSSTKKDETNPMENIMAKLTPPEQEYLEHAMSVKSYLPPGKEYQSPKSVKGNRFSIMAEKAIL